VTEDQRPRKIDWDAWYETAVRNAGGESRYFKQCEEYNRPLIDAIKREFPPPKRILEVGVGFGFAYVMLKNAGYDVVGIDNDPRALVRTRAIFEKFSSTWLCGQEVQLSLGDAFDLKPFMRQGFDATFSSGVMEHFSLKKAIEFLQEQGRVAQYIITAVPSKYVNENFEALRMIPYTPRLLRRVCEEAGLSVLREIQYGHPPRIQEFKKAALNPGLNTSKLGRLRNMLGSLKRSNRAWTLATICTATYENCSADKN